MGKIIVRALFVQFLVVGAWAQSQSLDCRFDGDDELSFQLNVNPGQGGGELTLWRYLSFAKEDQLKSNELKNCTVQRVGLEKQEIVVSCLFAAFFIKVCFHPTNAIQSFLESIRWTWHNIFFFP